MTQTQIYELIAKELGAAARQVEAAVKLIDEGNTIPFIARYRKEVTGKLDDTQLRTLGERLIYLRNLQERKEKVLESIEEQGKLTDALRARIEAAQTQVEVEDLYLPYRPKRRTRAGIAKERGLEGLAEFILAQKTKVPVEQEAARYISEEKEVPDAAAALAGARDIIAEQIAENADYRAWIREKTWEQGTLVTAEKAVRNEEKAPAAAKERRDVYEMYFEYEEKLSRMPGHRVLAINRGEKEKILTAGITAPADKIEIYLLNRVTAKTGTDNPYTVPQIKEAVHDSYVRLIAPAVERELRARLTEAAEDGAITVFASNLEQLLMQQPIAGKVVLGWDPAFRTGCKLAIADPTGKVLDTKVIFPTAPQNRVREAKADLEKLVKRYNVSVISVGNGTASRESEQVITDFIREHPELKLRYVIVNEAGASVYSASKLAAEEFPQFDVGQRSAASIARRLQDPLAELVKIDPKAIGVGQYQHDMNQKKLDGALAGVVERCVNSVGVDLNTASAPLLSHISGINAALAKNIVAFREENGRFTSRKALLKVPKLGPKAFEQCAGFLRIADGDELMDATAVHPESYPAVEKLLKMYGLQKDAASLKALRTVVRKPAETAAELGIGEITLTDILAELEKPSRDPRQDMPAPVLRSDVLSMEDLTPGLKLKGTVRNIVDFGAFVDIGVHQDGLVHISRISKRFIKHPLEAVHVGDVVEVTVLAVDMKKKRISLSMVD